MSTYPERAKVANLRRDPASDRARRCRTSGTARGCRSTAPAEVIDMPGALEPLVRLLPGDLRRAPGLGRVPRGDAPPGQVARSASLPRAVGTGWPPEGFPRPPRLTDRVRRSRHRRPDRRRWADWGCRAERRAPNERSDRGARGHDRRRDRRAGRGAATWRSPTAGSSRSAAGLQGDRVDRRHRLRGRARVHRHPHPLRRPGVLGPGADAVVLPRRHHRRRRQLRLLDRPDACPTAAS